MVTALVVETKQKTHKISKSKVPDYLISEVIDGVAFYFRGYQEVLNKTKTLEDIMSDSGLQFFLKDYLSDILKAGLDRKKYRIASGELGFNPNLKVNMGLDVVVFDRNVLTAEKITTKFVDVAPKFVIEVDVNVEISSNNNDIFQEYIVKKVERLFSFGTEKVIWIFTKSKKILTAIPNASWQFDDWNNDVELLDGVKINLAKYIEEEGFNTEI
jgi:hypothetical protein